MKPISNPPNPWKSTQVEWIDAPPPAKVEIYEEKAKTIVAENDSPDLGFRYSLNPYRGCQHACAYCLSGDTRILLGDGSTRELKDLRVGDQVYGIDRRGQLHRTPILAHWVVGKTATRVELKDGRLLVGSRDHRLLTPDGWKRLKDLVRGDRMIGLGTSSSRANGAPGVAGVDHLQESLPVYDITTGLGNFIANGVVSHNCYARPSHQYWDFDAGTDFETKIVVKVNAPEKLRERFLQRSWTGELLVFSGNTDCYQPLEACYELTRRCLEVCAEFRQPVGMITKGALIRRDIDLLQELAKNARIHVNVSVAFADDEMARKIEPGAPSPSVRFKALKALAEAGIPVGVACAPI